MLQLRLSTFPCMPWVPARYARYALGYLHGTVFKCERSQRYCQGRLSESDSDSAADLLRVQGGSSMSAEARTGPQAPLQRRIAVVGSGISGLSAAWLLHRCARVCN